MDYLQAMFTDKWFDKRRDVGVLLLRIFVSLRLIYGVADNVLSWEQMLHFRDFLQNHHFPFPLWAAILSVYAQLLAGLMILAGWRTRLGALLMIINFTVAIIMVHRNDTIEQMTPALFILFVSVFLLFYGSGKFPIDERKEM